MVQKNNKKIISCCIKEKTHFQLSWHALMHDNCLIDRDRFLVSISCGHIAKLREAMKLHSPPLKF